MSQPSPHSTIYYGVVEFNNLFVRNGFKTRFQIHKTTTNLKLSKFTFSEFIAIRLHNT